MSHTSASNGVEPLYQQIIDEYSQQILSGTLHAGASLPSIRSYAKERDVSVITVKRAYLELERRGLIFTQPGKGSKVAADQSRALEGTRRALEVGPLADRPRSPITRRDQAHHKWRPPDHGCRQRTRRTGRQRRHAWLTHLVWAGSVPGLV